jgi:phosphopantetheine adenylyltransferase
MTRTKAKFNEENFQIMNLIRAQPTFKAVFFQVDKDLKKNRMKRYEGTAAAVEKHMEEAENTKQAIAKDEDAQRAAQAKLLLKSMDMIDDLSREVKMLSQKMN